MPDLDYDVYIDEQDIPDISSIKPDNPEDYKCAPTKTFENGSCIPLNLLVEMAHAYNEKNSDKLKLCRTIETLNPQKYKKYLVDEFSKRLSNVCDSQKCWVKQDFVNRLEGKLREELSKNTYRPVGPGGKFTWLNTFNINDVMSQYEHKYTDFKFLGALPIDFDELPGLGIKNLNFDQVCKNENKKRWGVVFNLDEHYKDGSHWVAMYADFNKGEVYFFDSYGVEPEPRIRKFMRRCARYMENKLNLTPKCDYNKTKHQQDGSECGVYSINFILRMLKGETFEEINGKRMPDEEVNKCREVYFTKPK